MITIKRFQPDMHECGKDYFLYLRMGRINFVKQHVK